MRNTRDHLHHHNPPQPLVCIIKSLLRGAVQRTAGKRNCICKQDGADTDRQTFHNIHWYLGGKNTHTYLQVLHQRHFCCLILEKNKNEPSRLWLSSFRYPLTWMARNLQRQHAYGGTCLNMKICTFNPDFKKKTEWSDLQILFNTQWGK